MLIFLQQQGMINLDDVRNKMKETERQRLLSQHKYKIFQDKDGRWKTTILDSSKKNGRRLIAKTHLHDLENAIIASYSAVEDEKYIKENIYTLETIFPLWLDYKASQTDATSYSKRIIVDWNKFYKDTSIIHTPIKDFTDVDLTKWVHDTIRKYSLNKKQYYNMSIIMRQCLEYAVSKHIIDINPFNNVKVNKKLFTHLEKKSSDSQVFLLSEQYKLCQEANKRFRERDWCTTPLMILLNFQLGLRIGELVALKWEDINGDYIHIQRMEQTDYVIITNEGSVSQKSNGYKITDHTKTCAGDRFVYLNVHAKNILKQIKSTNIKYGYYDDGYIFIASRQKHRGTSRTLTKYLEELCVSSGITNKSNHKIRKTYISSLFDSQININTIRELAGHEDERTSLHNYCFDQKDEDLKRDLLESAANNIMII